MISVENPSRIYAGNTCTEYFKEMVESAVRNQHSYLSETTEFYIVNLLNECLNTEKVFSDTQEEEEPLTEKLNKALNSDYYEKIKRFKDLGDFTLFIVGFFPESLNRKLVNGDYYGVIGSTAYSNLAVVMKDKNNGQVFSSLYGELSEKFSPIADVLSEVSQGSSLGTNKKLLRVYESWLKTDSISDAEFLKKEGIIPTEAAKSPYLH